MRNTIKEAKAGNYLSLVPIIALAAAKDKEAISLVKSEFLDIEPVVMMRSQ